MDIKAKIKKVKSIIEEHNVKRQGGNAHDRGIDREAGRVGIKVKPDDIPTQDTFNRKGQIIPGNVSSHSFVPSTNETMGMYKMGSPVRPPIRFDSGFSKFPKQDPEISDYFNLLKWIAMLEGAAILRPDLSDGIAAYRHFHEGEGAPRKFDYERYVINDKSGQITLKNAILEAQDAAIKVWRKNGQPDRFSFTGPAIPCGSIAAGHYYIGKAFPYPATENWQKAIGAHVIWLSGDVNVKNPPTLKTGPSEPEFTMSLVLHAEDQYNFNPGQQDIASGAPDAENGRFVIVGFAQGYHHSSTLRRKFSWKGFDLGVAAIHGQVRLRPHQPGNNRFMHNRI